MQILRAFWKEVGSSSDVTFCFGEDRRDRKPLLVMIVAEAIERIHEDTQENPKTQNCGSSLWDSTALVAIFLTSSF